MSNPMTPIQWLEQCLGILHQWHPDYLVNPNIKGRFIEFVRADESGLLFSHSFVKSGHSYYYAAGLLFDDQLTVTANHCLVVGSRFEIDETIDRQFQTLQSLSPDTEIPESIWPGGSCLPTVDALSQAMSVVENQLLPHYRHLTRNGKSRFIELFQTADNMLCSLPDEASESEVRALFPRQMLKLQNLTRELESINGLTLAVGGTINYRYRPDEPGFEMASVAPELIVLYQLPVFWKARSRLKKMVEIAQAL